MCHRGDMRVTGVDACRHGWVAVSLDAPGPAADLPATDLPATDLPATDLPATDLPATDPVRAPARPGSARAGRLRVDAVRAHASLAGVLEGDEASVVGIDMPLGLLESGWREADRAARGLLGPRRSSVFAIPPREVWAQASYPAANQRCRELTGQGLPIQAWGLRVKLLEADQYRVTCGHPLYEVHPELAFGALAGTPLVHSKHTPAGRELRRRAAGSGRHRGPPGPAGSGDGHAGRGGRRLERLAHRHWPSRRRTRPTAAGRPGPRDRDPLLTAG